MNISKEILYLLEFLNKRDIIIDNHKIFYKGKEIKNLDDLESLAKSEK
jgi:hypothetical protein